MPAKAEFIAVILDNPPTRRICGHDETRLVALPGTFASRKQALVAHPNALDVIGGTQFDSWLRDGTLREGDGLFAEPDTGQNRDAAAGEAGAK